MSLHTSLLRQVILIRRILSENAAKRYPSMKDLSRFVEEQMEKLDPARDADHHPNTFKRDIKQIRDFFRMDITYERKHDGYFIDELDPKTSFAASLLDSIEILASLGSDTMLPEYIIPEKRKSTGAEHFPFLARRIKERQYVRFNYYKFDTGIYTEPEVAPCALKSSRGRWYLIGRAKGEEQIKAYGLDRISAPSGTGVKFRDTPPIKDINTHYHACFAMFHKDEAPQDVTLSFDKTDGNYILSYPIHHSQSIEYRDEKVIVHLHLRITPDFIMELMSRSWSLEVISPVSLREQLREIYSGAVSRHT